MKVVVERLGHQGDGIARGENGPIFLPGMLPGEEVEVEMAGDKVVSSRIVTPSSERRKAPCPHYKTCGGCALQHATDPFVADWKVGVVRQALAGQGLSGEIRGISTSPAHSRRRATLSGRRTKSGVSLGFHMRGSDQMVAVPNCQLLHPDLMALFPALEALVKLGASRKDELSMTVTLSLTGPDVAVTGGKELDANLLQDLGAWAETHGIARVTWEREHAATRNPALVPIGPARVPLPPGAFLQATAHGEAALLAAVREAIGTPRKVIDLFAGCGTFSIPLADTSEVHAVEGADALTKALAAGANFATGLKTITTETRDLFRRPLMPDELRHFEAAVIDPPRAGAESQVAQLAKSTIKVIAMVSCNPITFARDAKVLIEAGYTLDWVRVVDQFRWSTHVELAARFSRA